MTNFNWPMAILSWAGTFQVFFNIYLTADMNPFSAFFIALGIGTGSAIGAGYTFSFTEKISDKTRWTLWATAILGILIIFPITLLSLQMHTQFIGWNVYSCDYINNVKQVFVFKDVYYLKAFPQIHTPMSCEMHEGWSVYLDMPDFMKFYK